MIEIFQAVAVGILIVTAILFYVVIVVNIFKNDSTGCSGNCNQGRTKCDCKKIF